MTREVIDCDNCGTQKKESNNWFKVFNTKGQFTIYRGAEGLIHGEQCFDLCGRSCLSIMLTKWIENKPLITADQFEPKSEPILNDPIYGSA